MCVCKFKISALDIMLNRNFWLVFYYLNNFNFYIFNKYTYFHISLLLFTERTFQIFYILKTKHYLNDYFQ